MKRSHPITLLIALAMPCIAFAAEKAEPLPLSTSYWRDPAFLKSFNGSYRIEARIEPVVTTEERGLLVEVQQLMAKDNRTGAIDQLQKSDLTEKSPALTFNLANLQFEEGNLEKAIEGYRKAIAEMPSFRRAQRNLAVALVRQNDLDAALPHLLEAIRLGDADGATYGLLGYCRLQRGEWASALQAYRLAQLSEPDTVDWLAGIAQCLQNLDAREEAAALLDEVVRKRPQESSYAILRASVLLDLDRRTDAVEALELPYRLGTLAPDATLLLADLHLRDGRTSVARERMQAAYVKEDATKPDVSRVAAITASALHLGDLEFAKEALALAAPKAGEPPSNVLRLLEAMILIQSKENVAGGVDILRDLIARDPADPRPLLELARHLISPANASVEALGEAELLLERAATQPEAEVEARLELARLNVRENRYEAAVEAAERAFSLDPRPEIREYLDSLKSLADAAR